MVKLNWDKKELLNQLIHALIGLGACIPFIIFGLKQYVAMVLISFAIGLTVEICQKLYKKEAWNLLDRLRDIAFYVAGGVIGIIINLIVNLIRG